MENTELQRRVREQRVRRGLSQEELAERANLSLRTIQRIERGATAPRGDTLKRLAVALQVSPDDLIDWQEEEDHNVLTVMNLSQLAFVAFPLLGLIIPLAIWILKKNAIRHVDSVGQAILNFQATWNLVLFTLYSFALLTILLQRSVAPWLFYSFFSVVGALYLYNLILIVANTLGYRKTKRVRYAPAIRFLN